MFVYHPAEFGLKVYRSGDRAVNVIQVTKKWGHYHHLLGKINTLLSTIQPSLVVAAPVVLKI